MKPKPICPQERRTRLAIDLARASKLTEESAIITDLICSAAAHLGQLYAATAARTLRRVFPTAISVQVDAVDWYNSEGGVELVAVLDDDGQLWDDNEIALPHPDWDLIRLAVESEIDLALENGTPEICGWEGCDRDDRTHNSDLYRIALPDPGELQAEAITERILTALQPAVARLGLTLIPANPASAT